jgi:outer membrane protein OmpA-like peptidoglycan-associated protein
MHGLIGASRLTEAKISMTARFLNFSNSSRVRVSCALAVASIALLGCASMSSKEKGAVVGATTGGAVGAVVGNATGSTARGAIIGAVVGGTAGAIIGHQMDQQAKELKVAIPGATVERVGEGIQVTFASGLLYDFDSDAIKPTAAENLRKLAASLKEYPTTDLLIVGHTDGQGSDDYNMALSQRRAVAASTYLEAQGVAASRLRATGRGELEPVASNDTDAGRQTNRRIEVAIYSSKKANTSSR